MSSTLVDRANELRRAVERLERKMQRAIDRNRWEDFLALRLGAFYIRREQLRIVRLFSSTDRAQLTDGQRVKLDDMSAKVADQRSFMRRQTFELRRLLPAPMTWEKK